jgi:hypothetical protein
MGMRIGVFQVYFICVICFVGSAIASQPDQPTTSYGPEEIVDWDVLPNGLIVVQHDRTGDGIPDQFTLHQIIWSGWNTQTVQEIEAQAQVDRQWAFIVEYDQDRHVYLTGEDPLLAGDVNQDSSVAPARSSELCSLCTPYAYS